jgi:hypothetical protein
MGPLLASLSRRIGSRIKRTLGLPPYGRLAQDLVIIATRRTGSSFLCDCLRSFPDALSLREIYNPSGTSGSGGVIPALARRSGQAFSGWRDKKLIEWARSDPMRHWAMLAAIARAKGKTLLSFKVFDKHLPASQVGAMLAARRPAVLFLVRNRLDVYISARKAGVSSKWAKADTTDIGLTITTAEFLRWCERIDSWYGDVLGHVMTAGLPFLVLRYEDHVSGDPSRVTQVLAEAFGELGIATRRPVAALPSRYIRQDRAPTTFDKIANGDAIRTELRQMGKLDYALSPPLTDSVWSRSSPEASGSRPGS